MSNTPKLVLPELSVSQSSKEVTVNDSLRILDALVQFNVISQTTPAQPGSPADGATYILTASPTGTNWAGHAREIAYFKSTAWIFLTPDVGMLAYVVNEAKFYVCTASGPPAVWTLQAASAAIYDIGCSVQGTPVVSVALFRIPAPRSFSFPASFTSSKAVCGTNPTSTTIFSIRKNGSEIGTASFNTSGVCTYAGAGGSFVPGTPDVLTIVAPSNLNGIADVGFMLVATLT